jgi:hypothetical protein
MQRFTDLKVWHRAHVLALTVYRVTSHFPKEERYGLTTQLRRAATSVPTNIAEGSLAETEYLLMLARDLAYASDEAVRPLQVEADEVARMLNSLRGRVESG